MSRENSSLFSRRNILAGLGLGAASVGALAAPALKLDWTRKPGTKSWWDRPSVSLATAGMDEWTRHVGTEFSFAGQGGAVAARLAAVEPLNSKGKRPRGLRDRAFALVFESTGAALPAGDRIFDVSHSTGSSKMFLSACGDKCTGRRLQAIFN